MMPNPILAVPDAPTGIAVTVDKSHLITIGERLYTESIELIRELVNNAYDADATEVQVTMSEEEIIIQDNGAGMNLKGLRQYFNIGSAEKKIHAKSPQFHRDRIGQFGIGKFASLTACRQFEIVTQKGDFCASVVFDKVAWEQSPHSWMLPLALRPPNPLRGNGTTVTLRRLVRSFDVEEVRRRLMESVPLKAPEFVVLLNGQKVMPRYYSGHRIGIMEGTRFGPVFGEIIILPASQVFDEETGIEIKVRQVTVCREFFGLDDHRELAERMRGEVHADFLPVTSDRTGFVKDGPEYVAFLEAMRRVVAEVRHVFSGLSGRQERRRASRALNEALERITTALNRNPELAPFGVMPSGTKEREGPKGVGEEVPSGARSDGAGAPEVAAHTVPKPRKKRITVKRLSPDAVVKRLRLGSSKIACCLDHFGPQGPECQTEGSVIYINRDHPLYTRAMGRPTTYTMHIARLLTQEITLMKNPSTARQAFLRQSRLLKDAFVALTETVEENSQR